MPIAKTFDDLYANELSDLLYPLEKERKEGPKPGYLCYFLGASTIVLFIFSAAREVQLSAVAAFITLIGTVIAIVFYNNKKKAFVSVSKEQLFGASLTLSTILSV
jgi:hypothetical protein